MNMQVSEQGGMEDLSGCFGFCHRIKMHQRIRRNI